MGTDIRQEKKRMPMTEAQKKSIDKYLRANTISVCMRVNKNTDPDVVEFLASIDNKRAYLLSLIRKDIAERKKTEDQK